MGINKLAAPLLLITFNRPEATQLVIEAIKEAAPEKIYIFNDGPRAGNLKDLKAREEIQNIINQMNWKCKVYSNFSEKNLGCGLGVSSAISWAFKNEDRLIILEDDCIPAPSFFPYCNELLERYKDDSRIWHISGNNYCEEVDIPYSYIFSKFVHIWGWATWKRCWKNFDLFINNWPEFDKYEGFYNLFYENRLNRFLSSKIKKIYKDRNLSYNNWDLQFWYMVLSQGGLSIIPKKNLVTNIGSLGVHSSENTVFHNRKISNDFKIQTHPTFFIPYTLYERHHFRYHWAQMIRKPIFKRAVKRLIKKG